MSGPPTTPDPLEVSPVEHPNLSRARFLRRSRVCNRIDPPQPRNRFPHHDCS